MITFIVFLVVVLASVGWQFFTAARYGYPSFTGYVVSMTGSIGVIYFFP